VKFVRGLSALLQKRSAPAASSAQNVTVQRDLCRHL
jgi:hypothetical protein